MQLKLVFVIAFISMLPACSSGSGSNSSNSSQYPIERPETQLSVTKSIRNDTAYADLLEDGTVITWGQKFGDYETGANSSKVQGQLYNIIDIYPTNYGFLAVRSDRQGILWGGMFDYYNTYGASKEFVESSLSDISSVVSNSHGFLILKNDSTGVFWAASNYGFYNIPEQADLTGISSIYANNDAFVALFTDGTVKAWGSSYVASTSTVIKNLHSITSISLTDHAACALRSDNSVITWGKQSEGGATNIYYKQANQTVSQYSTTSTIGDQLYNIEEVVANNQACAARRADGKVISWGKRFYGAGGWITSGASESYELLVKNINTDLSSSIEKIFSNEGAFAVVKSDKSVLSWGISHKGGDNSEVASELYNIKYILSYKNDDIIGFDALREDDIHIIW